MEPDYQEVWFLFLYLNGDKLTRFCKILVHLNFIHH